MLRRSRPVLLIGLVVLLVGVLGLVLVVPALASGPTTSTPTAVGTTGMAGMLGGPVAASALPIGIDRATANARAYVASLGDPNLQLSEVMEFSANYYAQVIERDTGIHAFELLIDRYTGAVYPGTLPLGAFEGSFWPCTFWLAIAHARAGNRSAAEAILARRKVGGETRPAFRGGRRALGCLPRQQAAGLLPR